jgi:hypothetical protein
MEKVYLKGGPFGGEVCAVEESVVIAQFSPGHVRYVDRGETNRAGQRIFVCEPREIDENIEHGVKVDQG